MTAVLSSCGSWDGPAISSRHRNPAIFASESAIAASGVQKSGIGTSASRRAPTQNTLLCVNSASRDKTATSWNWILLDPWERRSGIECSQKYMTPMNMTNMTRNTAAPVSR